MINITNSPKTFKLENAIYILKYGIKEIEFAAKLALENNAKNFGRVTGFTIENGNLIIRKASFGGRAEIVISGNGGPYIFHLQDIPQDIEIIETIDDTKTALNIKKSQNPATERSLEGAQIVVSCGRGLDEDDVTSLKEIASLIGGAISGSQAAVDIGLVPVSRQVGQSGKFVTPKIYFAFGISGTPQHMAGIGINTRIIAINNDADATIFKYSDTGIIADAKKLIPLLKQELEK